MKIRPLLLATGAVLMVCTAAGAQAPQNEIDAHIQAGKTAAGQDFRGTFVNLCLPGGFPPGAGRGSGGTDGGRPRGPLVGNALFEAQSLVFGRYLVTREGPAFVGALIDAQIQSRDIAHVFDAAQMVPSNLERLDIEFHRWLIDRAAHGK